MLIRVERQLPLLFFFLILLCWLLPGLLGHEPWKPDEAYTFGLVRHIARTGDWVVPTLAGEPFMEKPPLYFIVAAGFLNLLGGIFNPPDAVRLASGFFLLLAFLAVALGARALHGRGYGRWAVLALLSSVGLAVRAHQMLTDTALFAGMAWGLLGFVWYLRKPGWGSVALGLGGAVAFLSKGLLGPGLLTVTALCLPWCDTEFRRWRYAGFLLLALLVFLPLPLLWLISLYQRSPDLFHVWFWDNNIGRFTGSSDLGPKSGHLFYLALLPWYALPALPLAMWALWKQRDSVWPAAWRVLLVFFLGSFLVLSSASDARELYAMPLLLPLAMLAPAGLQLACDSHKVFRNCITGGFGLLMLGLWLAGLVLAKQLPMDLPVKLAARLPAGLPLASGWLYLLAAVVTVIMLALIFSSRLVCKQALLRWSAGFSLCWALVMMLGMPYLDYTKRYSDVFLVLRSQLPREGCVASMRLGEPQRALLEYYADLRTLRTEINPQAGQCPYFLLQSETTQPVLRTDGQLIWKGARAGDQKEWFELYRRN